MKKKSAIVLLILILISSLASSISGASNNPSTTSSHSSDQYDEGYRYNTQGWIYVHIEGDAYDRGFQHGYLLSAEITDMLSRWSNSIHNNPVIKPINTFLSEERYQKVSNAWWNFCTTNIYRMYWDKIPEEYQEEIQGIADGVTEKGEQIHGRNVTAKDILAMNQMYEFMSKLTRMRVGIHPFRTFLHTLEKIVPETKYVDRDALYNSFFDGEPPHHCNGFIATGNATTDGQLVFTQSTICGGGAWWWRYYISLRWNVMLDIQPTSGHRVLFSTSPGLIWSDEDYYQNDNGIVFLETTLPQGIFDNWGLPLSVRARTAVQYANTIDDVIYYLRYRNDGSMNAVWLIGDTKTGEICRFELGYRAYAVWRTFNGYYWSANNPYNIRVRLEKFNAKEFIKRSLYPLLGIPGFGFFSLKYRPELRDIKYQELGEQYYGEIDIDIVKEISMTSPISDWITDIKLTDSALLSNHGIWGFFGNPHKVLNITNFDTKQEIIRKVPPCGWVRFFGVPEKNDFSLLKKNTTYAGAATILWSFDTGENNNYFSSQGTVDADTLYITTSSETLYAIDNEKGDKIWSYSVGKNPTRPLYHDTQIFVGHSEGVSAFDASGTSTWNYLTDDVVSSPVIADDLLVFGTNTGGLFAVSCDTGESQWMMNFSDEMYLSPEYSDIIYCSSGKQCSAVSVQNHTVLWNFTADNMMTAAPVQNNGLVYVTSWDNHIYALNASDGSVVWSYEAGWGFDTTPLITNDVVIVASSDNNVYALNAKHGTLTWFFSCNAAIHSQPLWYGEYVFFGCDDGRLYAVNVSTGESAWYFSPAYTIDDDVYNFITTPFLSDLFVSDGVIYTGLNGTIYALDAQTVEIQEPDMQDPDEGSDEQPDDQHDIDEGDEQQDEVTNEDNDISNMNLELCIVSVILLVLVSLVLLFFYAVGKDN